MSLWLTTSTGRMMDCVAAEAHAPPRKLEKPASVGSDMPSPSPSLWVVLLVTSRAVRYTWRSGWVVGLERVLCADGAFSWCGLIGVKVGWGGWHEVREPGVAG